MGNLLPPNNQNGIEITKSLDARTPDKCRSRFLTDALQHFDAIRKEADPIKKAIALTPAGRLVTSEDIAEVVAFLCTPAGSMIRGQTILVDGGYTLPIQGVDLNSILGDVSQDDQPV